jgi:UDP-glucose 4-epimerase
MDFVHVADIARANILAAEAPITDDVFNIACGVETSLNDLAHALLTVMKSDLTPEYGPARTVNSVTRRLADLTHTSGTLGWAAELDLHEGLEGLVEWWRANKADMATGKAS